MGLVYGSGIYTGISWGFDYATQEEYALQNSWPYIEAFAITLTNIFSASIASYLSRSTICGLLAGSLNILLTLIPLIILSEGSESTLSTTIRVAGIIGMIPAAIAAKRLPIDSEDVINGCFFGIRWGHWFWLWLPWQGAISNAIWFCAPPPYLVDKGLTSSDLIIQFLVSIAGLFFLAFTTYKAVDSIRYNNGLGSGKSTLRFIFWAIVAPVVFNVWKIAFSAFVKATPSLFSVPL